MMKSRKDAKTQRGQDFFAPLRLCVRFSYLPVCGKYTDYFLYKVADKLNEGHVTIVKQQHDLIFAVTD
jgi:hypothetical protein